MPVALMTEPDAPANEKAPGAGTPPGSEAANLVFAAPVRANYALTGRESSAEKRHVEVDLAGSGLFYEPGDALAIAPRNDPRLVERLLEGFGLDGDAAVPGGADISLGAALANRFEIAVASPRFLKHWAMLSGSTELRALASPENTEARRRFLYDHHVVDIVRAFPVGGLAATTVLAGLRPLQPRLYSIASSPAETPGRAAIATSTLLYHLHGEVRRGVVSGFQVPAARPGTCLPVYVERQPDFRLPADDAPLIMVGAGTGIAPFRAFLAERRARRATGRSWLIMGARTAQNDFIYRTDWETALADGSLDRLDLAFSRDPAGKTYVQDRLREHGAAVFAWLEDGAAIYVCGDAAGMAPSVHAALIEIIEAHGGYSREDAMAYLRRLVHERRYQRSIY